MTKTVTFNTLGCRLNLAETGEIAQKFTEKGYEIVDFGQPADVSFLNTCTVTDNADSKCRNLIRKAQRVSPEGKIIVTGCYAQMESEAISQIKGVDLILGNSEKYNVLDYLDSEENLQIKIDQTDEFWGASTTPSDSHTRAFLKIQDGCNYICSFCIIPFARGRSKTISIAEAVYKAKEIVANGFKEIVLTGVNIGEYESTSGQKLSDLVKEILKIEGLERLRLSSVEPNTITDELLEVLANSPKTCEHFHIPLQSGDDGILKAMRRKYDSEFYSRTIAKIKSFFPNAGIGADVICGYPGETEKQFLKTVNFLEENPITHFHVFPFSKRKGTTAALNKEQLQSVVKNKRVKILRELGNKKLQEFSKTKIGETVKVLFEDLQDGFWTGYSEDYLRVFVNSNSNLKNQIKSVNLISFTNEKLVGEVI